MLDIKRIIKIAHDITENYIETYGATFLNIDELDAAFVVALAKERKELLIELSKKFMESENDTWRNYEVSDFLDTYE